MMRKAGLGRGLDALIPEAPDARVPTSDVSIDRIVTNPHQPRMTIDQSALDELTQSVREHGIIQPLLVSERPDGSGGITYQLIAGERRLRAARAAGLDRVPVTIRESTPQELLELAIIENVQRADLNSLEEATAYRRLIEEFQLTQREVAERVGRSRTAVANTLRLLDLPDEIRASLARAEITEGHARALLAISDPQGRLRAWQQVLDEGLNVRQTEQLARRGASEPATPRPPRRPDPDAEALVDSIRRSLGTRVSLRRSKKGRGSLTIHFHSDDELDGILERIMADPPAAWNAPRGLDS